MKKLTTLIMALLCGMALTGCSNEDANSAPLDTTVPTNSVVIENEATPASTTVSGSFTVCVRDVIPDYVFDDTTPAVAVVTEFQDYPFTIFVGGEIGKELVTGENYVFTIAPVVVDAAKEDLEKKDISSLLQELPQYKITDFRLATADELGLESRNFTFE